MDTQTLVERLAATLTLVKVDKLMALGEDPSIPVESLLEIAYDDQNNTIAFRAAWIIEYLATRHPDRFVPVFETFVSRLPTQRNHSCQRHFSKVLMLVTDPKAPIPYRQAYGNVDRASLVETLFGWLIDPHTPVAVQVNCLDILFNMSSEFEWIQEELKQQTEFLLRDGSAAMQSRGKKLLRKLASSKP